ncbi:hypothetical protein LDENG_00133000 [Lucifuga dentata]|nr:hypothetical protein LDENG_00133000 [Lucifuga dentata]
MKSSRNMKNKVRKRWCFAYLHCFLFCSLVDSASFTSSTVSVISTVGEQAVLPCSWKARVNQAAPVVRQVQWDNSVDTVYERWGQQRWQAEELEGRAEVSAERLKAGDCSLVINDVQIADTGLYHSFLLVDDATTAMKNRIFIQTVKLSVFDHKSRQAHAAGEDLVLELHTPHSLRLVFQSSNGSEWVGLWMRGDKNTQRLEKHADREQLMLKSLKMADEGTYKVLDEHGLAVSTVLLSVEENSTPEKYQQLQTNLLPGDATRISRSAPLFLSVLLQMTVL